MRTYFSLDLGNKKLFACPIVFGLADSAEERENIFRLRYEKYNQKKYIFAERYPDGKESDEYDLDPKTVYIIAKYNGEIFACVRLISTSPLPTEKVFDFEIPEEIKKIPSDKRIEFGRLIARKPINSNNYFPRGVVTFFLFMSIFKYAIDNGYVGGLAFIKKTLFKKMKKLHVPFTAIKQFRPTFKQDDVLFPYFTQEHDPVVPICFTDKKLSSYFKLASAVFFSRINEGEFVMRKLPHTILLFLQGY